MPTRWVLVDFFIKIITFCIDFILCRKNKFVRFLHQIFIDMTNIAQALVHKKFTYQFFEFSTYIVDNCG
jgi:hypothetical protein